VWRSRETPKNELADNHSLVFEAVAITPLLAFKFKRADSRKSILRRIADKVIALSLSDHLKAYAG
jgi:hypothetical protein